MPSLRKTARRASDALDRRRDDAFGRIKAVDFKKASDAELEAVIAAVAKLKADADDPDALKTLHEVAKAVGRRKRPWKSPVKFDSANRAAPDDAEDVFGVNGPAHHPGDCGSPGSGGS